MKRIRNPQKGIRHNPDWWKKTISQIESSSDSMEESCKKHGITASTFYKWRRKLKVGTGGELKFESINIPLQNEFEIHSPKGVRVVIRGDVNQSTLQTLLNEMEKAR